MPRLGLRFRRTIKAMTGASVQALFFVPVPAFCVPIP
jgi:hypothetical protein